HIGDGSVFADRHHRVQHGVVIHVNQVERLGAVASAGSTDRHVQVLRVAGSGCHRNGNPGEGGGGRVVQVPADDAADVAVPDDSSQLPLGAQLDGDRKVENAGHRRVVHGQDASVRRRGAQHV